jgi:hypothetical protein
MPSQGRLANVQEFLRTCNKCQLENFIYNLDKALGKFGYEPPGIPMITGGHELARAEWDLVQAMLQAEWRQLQVELAMETAAIIFDVLMLEAILPGIMPQPPPVRLPPRIPTPEEFWKDTWRQILDRFPPADPWRLN